MTELIAVLTLGGLTGLLATGLLIASRRLHVAEDPRIAQVEALLPATNCGGCGHPGCHAFATALTRGEVLPGACTVASDEQRTAIAALLGVAVGRQQRRVARLACAGGTNVARSHARYLGHRSCEAAALVAGGGKGCFWGCLGLGDCERSCDFEAIVLDAHALPVVDPARCVACGDCVDACPKELFSLQPVDQPLWVACRNEEQGEAVLDECAVGCTACGRCAVDAPTAITMRANLPVIDGAVRVGRAAIDRCPTGAIVWIERDGRILRGDAAAPVVRHGALPASPT
jgi:Na+-translocating ferredoxin:NAD+ oxidoreductase RNF subunit RnfB